MARAKAGGVSGAVLRSVVAPGARRTLFAICALVEAGTVVRRGAICAALGDSDSLVGYWLIQLRHANMIALVPNGPHSHYAVLDRGWVLAGRTLAGRTPQKARLVADGTTTRACLGCGAAFQSWGPGNRQCERCRRRSDGGATMATPGLRVNG